MSAFSNYLETAICNWIRGTAMPASPAAVFVGVFNGSPTDTGASGAEVTTTVRAAGRVAAAFPAPTDGVMSDSAAVNFGPAAASATFSHFGLFEAASGGNLLVHGALTGGSQTVSIATNVSFPAGSLTLTVAQGLRGVEPSRARRLHAAF